MINVILTKGGFIHSNHLYDDIKKAEKKFMEHAKEINPKINTKIIIQGGWVVRDNTIGHSVYLTWPELCLKN